jgi:hypothetical protein
VTWPNIGVSTTGPTGLDIWVEVGAVAVFAAIRIALAVRLQEHVPAYLRRIGPPIAPVQPRWAGASLRNGSTIAVFIATLVLAIRLIGVLAGSTTPDPESTPGGPILAGIVTTSWAIALVLFGLGALASLVGGVGVGVARVRRGWSATATQ